MREELLQRLSEELSLGLGDEASTVLGKRNPRDPNDDEDDDETNDDGQGATGLILDVLWASRAQRAMGRARGVSLEELLLGCPRSCSTVICEHERPFV